MSTAHGFTGVILAAGRGSRLGEFTANRPKCLVQLAGHPLLDWQIAALNGAGIRRIVAVTGYLSQSVAATGIDTIYNADWSKGNMVDSLMYALEALPAPFIVSYSDIVYSADHVRELAKQDADLAITYDLNWLDLWGRRFVDPLSDAETFVIDDAGRVLEIGGKTRSLEKIRGQYMGLIKLSAEAANWIFDFVTERPERRASLDMTSLLQQLIHDGRTLIGVPQKGHWCEIDDQKDLAVAEELLIEGRLVSPPWNGS